MKDKEHRIYMLTAIMLAALLAGGCQGKGQEETDKADASETDKAEVVLTTESENRSPERDSGTSDDGNQMDNTADERQTESEAGMEAGSESETESVSGTGEEKKLVIVLDPGHDSEYCTRNHPDLGVNEQDLNLAIGLACRERLEQYQGVEVYMTREDGSCPDSENGGDYCIEARTGYATELDADLFVSLHNNGTTGVYGAEANGTEVYVPNYSAYTEECRALGEIILDNLSELDLNPKGVFVRTKEEKGYYDDGSVQDWYYLISYSVEGGHPGMIIEHAYMDNPHDNEILKDGEKLKAMGIADADAIAEYYGLELKP